MMALPWTKRSPRKVSRSRTFAPGRSRSAAPGKSRLSPSSRIEEFSRLQLRGEMLERAEILVTVRAQDGPPPHRPLLDKGGEAGADAGRTTAGQQGGHSSVRE